MTDQDLAALLDPAPEARHPPLPRAVEVPVAGLFAGMARVRRRRALHPKGRVAAAVLRVPHDARLPAAWRALDGAPAVVRRSRGGGLPEGWPDVLGIAVRSGGQDLLLSSTLPLLPVVPWPARDPLRCTYSSLTPYRIGQARGLLVGRFAAAGREVRLELRPLRGASVPLGLLLIGEVLHGTAAERVRFDPWRTGAGLLPVGLLHRLRGPAYPASRSESYR